MNNENICQKLSIVKKEDNVWIYGYFQRKEAFSKNAITFWQFVFNEISLNLIPFKSEDMIALHIRNGDYIKSQNKSIYGFQSIDMQLNKAIEYHNLINSKSKVFIFTDSNEIVTEYLKKKKYEKIKDLFEIMPTNNAIDDLKEMASFRHIIGTNSTFSLCAGMLSWLKSYNQKEERPSLILPSTWFKNQEDNQKILNDLKNCDFTI
ncbi:alpha-1,2-fucosyltransferase [Prochlorococcus marinus]|uniref:alpha-1,2-fucosyltransferase n=1 Tax=Prochlorococcus marinus TaxID=1219 RepID=UPI0022B4A02D|nr:alpha-1,2-fucosyltransferase [Prochlorococcus marinus]